MYAVILIFQSETVITDSYDTKEDALSDAESILTRRDERPNEVHLVQMISEYEVGPRLRPVEV